MYAIHGHLLCITVHRQSKRTRAREQEQERERERNRESERERERGGERVAHARTILDLNLFIIT